MLLSIPQGDVAQLGERDNRTVEVRGSSPLISTATNHHLFLTIRFYLAIASNKQLGYQVENTLQIANNYGIVMLLNKRDEQE